MPLPLNIPNSRQERRIPPRWLGWAVSILVFALLVICAKPPSSEYVPASPSTGKTRLSSSTKSVEKASASGDVHVKCDLVTPFDDRENNDSPAADGTLEVTVHRGLAPLASNAFLDMVESRHFDHKYLFRVVQGFIVQFGIESPTPDGEDSHVKTKFPKVDIDPPPANVADSSVRSNVRGSLNFAGGNSGTGQVYINRGKNSHLDKEPGSLPFATLDERSMTIIDSVYSYKEGLGQVKAVRKGDEEVKRLFPRMSRIEKCWIERE